MKVEVGQVWELNGVPRGRIRGEVLEIARGSAYIRYECTGRVGTTSLNTLERGLRAAKCVLLADGSAPPPPPKRVHRKAKP